MECAPILFDKILSIESFRMSGPWLYVVFMTLVYIGGYVGVILNVLIALYIRRREVNITHQSIEREDFYRNVQEGDIILVCRSGRSGVALDIVELYVYNIIGTVMSGSILGHVGQVFRDVDGSLKVIDVRMNSKNSNRHEHFICSVEEFMIDYEGVKFWKQCKEPLTSEESYRLTKAVQTIGSQTGHCDDCFNPFRVLNTPSNESSPREILDFGKRYGFGCAENISFIRRAAGIDAPSQRFVLPHHFADQTIVRIE